MPTSVTPADRKNRLLDYSEETEALTMSLIRHAAAQAEQTLEPPPTTARPERGAAAAKPGAPEPSKPTARSAAPRVATFQDYVTSFTRLTRALNQTIASELRIANDDGPRATQYKSKSASADPGPDRDTQTDADADSKSGPDAGPGGDPTPAQLARLADDPRRPLLRAAFYQAVHREPDRARRRRQIDQAIDRSLVADPDRTRIAADYLEPLAEALAIKLDYSKLTDEVLGMPPRNNPFTSRHPGSDPPPESA